MWGKDLISLQGEDLLLRLVCIFYQRITQLQDVRSCFAKKERHNNTQNKNNETMMFTRSKIKKVPFFSFFHAWLDFLKVQTSSTCEQRSCCESAEAQFPTSRSELT
jgi:hypothetical protein